MGIYKIGNTLLEAYAQKPQVASERLQHPMCQDGKKTGNDGVSISKAARELQEAQTDVQSASDERAAKVAVIKKQVQDGTYQVSTEKLVDKLISLFRGQ